MNFKLIATSSILGFFLLTGCASNRESLTQSNPPTQEELKRALQEEEEAKNRRLPITIGEIIEHFQENENLVYKEVQINSEQTLRLFIPKSGHYELFFGLTNEGLQTPVAVMEFRPLAEVPLSNSELMKELSETIQEVFGLLELEFQPDLVNTAIQEKNSPLGSIPLNDEIRLVATPSDNDFLLRIEPR